MNFDIIRTIILLKAMEMLQIAPNEDEIEILAVFADPVTSDIPQKLGALKDKVQRLEQKLLSILANNDSILNSSATEGITPAVVYAALGVADVRLLDALKREKGAEAQIDTLYALLWKDLMVGDLSLPEDFMLAQLNVLHIAALFGRDQSMEKLLRLAPPSIINCAGQIFNTAERQTTTLTPLLCAVFSKNRDAVALILERKNRSELDFATTKGEGFRALSGAVLLGLPDILDLLLPQPSTHIAQHRDVLLHWAYLSDSIPIVRKVHALLGAPWNTEMLFEHALPAFQQEKKGAVLDYFLETGADVYLQVTAESTHVRLTPASLDNIETYSIVNLFTDIDPSLVNKFLAYGAGMGQCIPPADRIDDRDCMLVGARYRTADSEQEQPVSETSHPDAITCTAQFIKKASKFTLGQLCTFLHNCRRLPRSEETIAFETAVIETLIRNISNTHEFFALMERVPVLRACAKRAETSDPRFVALNHAFNEAVNNAYISIAGLAIKSLSTHAALVAFVHNTPEEISICVPDQILDSVLQVLHEHLEPELVAEIKKTHSGQFSLFAPAPAAAEDAATATPFPGKGKGATG